MGSIFKEYRLGEICKVHRGLSFTDYGLESGTPIIKKKNIRGGKVVVEDVFYGDETKHKVLDIHRVRYEDVVITNVSPGGKVAINLTDMEFILGGEVFKLEPNPEILNRRYLYYFLMNSPQQIEQALTLANVVRLHVSSIEKFKIHVPDLKTQLEIVRYLDTFRELREELRMRKQQGVYYRDKIMSSLRECALLDK
ncbi:type I restriction-modification system, S subunit [Mycoplasma haemofelis str. Langford 1]|uniref:Type I restriction enzyme specificity HsdS domain protein n=2 Tax=Mycoplasma haemofelis TaxID=29501 RepID=F6FIJ2_MYCHI|nr:restriction endonuclease subunit S [Mycoplasma haemofelis]AEG73040.1 type I restriction enzyme specificity HsdS domain protein [Mycoplasma haemofelis Ohio2]CBY92706.1 type I restriction-modification system, S subunit [Mycoplasma haemofelis str. Langford 1]